MYRVLLTVIVLMGCGYNNTALNAQPLPDPNGSLGTPVGYEEIRTKILEQYCTKCHVAGGGRSGVDLTTYAKVKLVAKKALSEVQKDKMPMDVVLPADLKTLLKNWVDQGAPEVAADVTATNDGGTPQVVLKF